MTLPGRQRRLLKAIDRQLTTADPRLAALFGAFSEAGESEPPAAHEQLPPKGARFRALLWEALCQGTWPVAFAADPRNARAVGETDRVSGSNGTQPEQGEQPPRPPR